MILLFPSTEQDFSTNGLGALSDAISCRVTIERNGAEEVEMEYPTSGIHYHEIILRNIIFVKPSPYDEPQPFRIYRITRPLNGRITVYAQHVSYDLSGIPVSLFDAASVVAAFSGFKTNAAVPNPFSFWTDKFTQAAFSVKVPSSIRSLLGGAQGSILDVYGGEYEFDRWTVKLWSQRGQNNGVTIRYGKNLTDLQQDENIANMATGVYPYWQRMGEGEILVELPEKVVNAPGTYGFTRIIPLDLSFEFDEQPTMEQLRSRAQKYIESNKIGVPVVSLTVAFQPLDQTEEYKDLALLERVNLCDTVTVEYPDLGVSATAKCIKTVYDALKDRYLTIELGDAHTDIADMIAGQQKEIEKAPSLSMMKEAIARATNAITGNKGGYVVLRDSNNDGEPDEILIMNTPDVKTATKVWRWNNAGLGYSSKGYNGPFELAITADGSIVADFITSGTIRGSLIEADSIKTSAISQSFKSEVTNEITGATNRVEQAFVAADEQIRSLISDTVTELSDELLLTEQRLTEIQQTVENLSISFSDRFTGGINNIRNSSGVNGVSSDWEYTGAVTAEQNAESKGNTLSGAYFTIAQGHLLQTVDVMPDTDYTITMKARSLSAYNVSARIVSGGNEIYIFDMSEITDWKEYGTTFHTNANQLTIEIAAEYGMVYAADLMLTVGTAYNRWTPAPNEIYTKDVKIDRQGIEITNSESETSTIINNVEFAVKHKNEKVITVNKDLTILKKSQVTDDFTVGKLKFIPTKNGGMNIVLLD